MAFYEFPSVELAFLSDVKGEWDKAKPYSSQVLFKFSSPLSTSCASSLSMLLGMADSEGKKLREDLQNRATTCCFAVSPECSKLFSRNAVKVIELS